MGNRNIPDRLNRGQQIMLLGSHKKRQEDIVNARYAEIYAHIEKLETGEENHLAALYPVLLSGDKTLENIVAKAIHAYMECLDAANIIRLDRQFRQYTSMEWLIEWKKVSPGDLTDNIVDQQARLNILRLGTLHPNGYFREKCMRALADNEESFGYIALRLNDWVRQIRETAYWILSDRLDGISTDTAVGMIPLISRTKRGERYVYQQFQEIEEQLSEKILSHLQEISLDKIKKYPPAVKRFLYKILISPDVLSKREAERLLEREKSGNEKQLVMRLILQKYECSEAQIEGYLQNKSPIVRQRALAVKYERRGSAWEGIEKYLLDTAGGIRGDVCHILRRHTDFDILAYYKQKLHTSEETVALLGIGENGSVKDANVLVEYLYADRPKLVKNAMKALSGLGAVTVGTVKLADIYWDYLNGIEATLAKAAYNAICKCDISYGAEKLYRTYISCTNADVRKYLIRMLMREPSWERLPYLLLVYEPDNRRLDETQFWIYKAIASRSVYARITKEWADFIMETMKKRETVISDTLKKEILFDLEHISIV